MQRLPKMSTPIWVVLSLWTVMCGFLTLNSLGGLGQWHVRAEAYESTNAYLVRELTFTQEQLRHNRTDLAATRTQLAATQNQLLTAQTKLRGNDAREQTHAINH